MIEQLIRHHPVIPVVTIDDLEDALPLAEALVAGGLTALEITLRTPVAIEAIRLLAEEVPDDVILVSESGLKDTTDAQKALDSGANAILIGETLMRHDDPTRAVEEYLALRTNEE